MKSYMQLILLSFISFLWLLQHFYDLRHSHSLSHNISLLFRKDSSFKHFCIFVICNQYSFHSNLDFYQLLDIPNNFELLPNWICQLMFIIFFSGFHFENQFLLKVLPDRPLCGLHLPLILKRYEENTKEPTQLLQIAIYFWAWDQSVNQELILTLFFILVIQKRVMFDFIMRQLLPCCFRLNACSSVSQIGNHQIRE